MNRAYSRHEITRKTVFAIWTRIFILLFLLLITSQALVAQPKEIVIGTSTGYPPFYYSENGKIKGLCPDVIEHVLGELDIKATYKQYSWSRMISSAQLGRVDAIMPLFKTTEREDFLFFADNQIAEESNQFFVRSESPITEFTGYAALQSMSIGIIRNYSYSSEFDENTDLRKFEYYTDEILIKAIYNKRIDVAIGNQQVITYKARLIGFNVNELRFLMPFVTKAPLYIGFSKKKDHKVLSEKFSRKLMEFKASPEYQIILDRYR